MRHDLPAFRQAWKTGGVPPTPFYAYAEERLEALTTAYLDATKCDQIKIIHHYALKANSNSHVLKFFRAKGFGLDVVSGSELRRGLKHRFAGNNILFSGVGKTNEEIELAIAKKIESLNIESVDELFRAAKIAKRQKKKLKIAIRVNPDVDAKTHPYITTGLHEHKFGVDFAEAFQLYQHAKKEKFLAIEGIGFHIGSQLFEFSALREAAQKTLDFARRLRGDLGIVIQTLDVGGGLGVLYETPNAVPPFQQYGEFLRSAASDWLELQGPAARLATENGRALVALAGILVSRVIQTKSNARKNFLILDASMTELIRPSLYEAWHPIDAWSVAKNSGEQKVYDVVGPVCESGDFLGLERSLPADIKAGDLYVIGCAGAYGYVMSSHYNGRPLPAEWWVPARGKPILSTPKIEKKF